jgi:hypothetical protein
MFGAHKETLMLAAIVVALVTCFYLYNEHKKTKTDIESVKSLVSKLPVSLPQQPPSQPQAKPRQKAKIVEIEPEPESED